MNHLEQHSVNSWHHMLYMDIQSKEQAVTLSAYMVIKDYLWKYCGFCMQWYFHQSNAGISMVWFGT